MAAGNVKLAQADVEQFGGSESIDKAGEKSWQVASMEFLERQKISAKAANDKGREENQVVGDDQGGGALQGEC